MISADLQPSDSPPFYCLVATGGVSSQGSAGREEEVDGGEGWALAWRNAVRVKESRAVPLPTPPGKQYYASLQTVLKLPARQLAPLHR